MAIGLASLNLGLRGWVEVDWGEGSACLGDWLVGTEVSKAGCCAEVGLVVAERVLNA